VECGDERLVPVPCPKCSAPSQGGAAPRTLVRSTRERALEALRQIDLDCGWAEDLHRTDPKALLYAVQRIRARILALASSPETPADPEVKP